MNRDTERTFKKINAAISAFCGTTREAYRAFDDAEAKAKTEAAAYKDERGEFQRRVDAAAETARQAYKQAREVLEQTISPEIDSLEKEYRSQLLCGPAPAFYQNLKVYSDFGITPSKAEAEQLLAQTNGAPLAVKALNKVLESTGAKLTVTPPPDYEHDLKILRLVSSPTVLYAPADMRGQGAIWGGQKRPTFSEDGNLIVGGFTWDTVSTITANSFFESYAREISGMSNKWSASFQPKLSQISDYAEMKSESGEVISPAQQFIEDLESTADSAKVESAGADIEVGQRIGQARANSNMMYQAVLTHYKK